MKKIILIAGIFSFSCVTAQNNDLFNPKEYLERKAPRFLPKQGSFFNAKPNKMTVYEIMPDMPEAKLSHTLSNGNKVFILPQDNMPCIVPDMNQFSAMANSYRKDDVSESTIGQIPNAIPRIFITPIIPGRK